jgi:hypothetical protein
VTDGELTRRACVGALSIPVLGALAGCGAGFAEEATPTPRSHDALEGRALYVAGEVSLSLPDGVEDSDDPTDADVIVLPAGTDRSAETAVEWISSGKRVALVGSHAQETWLAWQGSDAYAAAYPDHRGRARGCGGGGSGSGADADGEGTDCEPPQLVVVWEPPEGPPTTYRKSWGGTGVPSEREVLGGIADAVDGSD